MKFKQSFALKSRSSLVKALACSVGLLAVAQLVPIALPSARAATLTWDTAAGDGATVTAGSGTWSLAAGNWNNAGVDTLWTQTSTTSGTNSATFGGADGTYAITIGANLAAGALTFNNSGYILSGSSAQVLNVNGSGSARITVASGKTASIGNNLTVAFNNGGTTTDSGTRITLGGAGSILNIDAGATVTRTVNPNTTTGVGTNGTVGFAGIGTVNIAGTFSNSAAGQGTQGGILLATTAADAIVVNVNNGGLVQSTIGGNGLLMTNNATATATLNLNTGGTVFVQKVSEGSTTTGTSNFNFDGGTLKASVNNNTNFMTGLDSVKIKSNGAIIDTNTFDVTIGQNLLTDAVSTGGGLTKNSTGVLTLTGANTYTGATAINGGTLTLSGSGAINSSSGITINGSGAKLVQTSSTASTPAVTLTQGTLDGTTTVGAVTVGSAGAANTKVVANGNGASTTALTLGSLTFNGSGTTSLRLAGGATTTGPGLIVTNGLTLSGGAGSVVVGITPTSGLANGSTYQLIGYGGTFSGNAATDFTLASGVLTGRQSGAFASTAASNGFITLAVSGDNPVWSGAANNVLVEYAPNTALTTGNLALKTGHTATDFWTGDALEFNDTYNVGAGDVAITATTVNINGGVANAGGIAATSITFNNSAVDYTLSSSDGTGITAGSVVKNGTRTVTINTANTYAGGTTINGGTLAINSASSLGAASGALTLNNGTLQTTANISTSRNITLGNANSTILTDPSTTYTVSGVLSGSGALNKAGTGALVLSNANTFTGGVVISGGTLQLGSGSTTGALATTSAITNNGTLAFNRSNTITQGTSFNSVIGGSGVVSQLGSGTLVLNGTNTYSGGTTINAGALSINADAALGTAPGSPSTNVTFTGNSTLLGAASAVTLGANRSIQINTGATATFNAGAAANVLTINGSVSNQTNTGNFSLATSAGNAATGTVVLAGTNNFATGSTIGLGGNTNLGGGNLRLANSSALGSNAVTINATSGNSNWVGALELSGGVTIGSNVTLNISGHNQGGTGADNLRNQSGSNTFNGAINITTSGGFYQIDSADASGTLTLGGNISNTLATSRTLNFIGAGNTVASGVLQETGTAGTQLVVAKSGTGTLTLTASNTYTGATTVTSGTLNLSNQFATQNSTVTMNGGSLVFDQTVAGNAFTFGGLAAASSGAGFDIALRNNAGSPAAVALTTGGNNSSTTYSGVLSGSGSLTKTGTGTLTLTATNTYTGLTTVSNGTLAFDVSETLTGGLNVATSGTAVLTAHTGGAAFVKVLDLSALTISGTTPFAGDGGKDLGGLSSPAPVPEPGTIGLLAVGTIGGLLLRRRNRKSGS